MLIKNSTFGERMRMVREEKSMSLQEVGKKIGISKQALSRYEKDERSPRQPTVESLARFFEVSPTWLMGYDVKRNYAQSTREKMIDIADKLDLLDEKMREKLINHFNETINLYLFN